MGMRLLAWIPAAIVTLRLTHDGAALAQLRKAAAISVEVHKAGMAATRTAVSPNGRSRLGLLAIM